MDLSDVYILLFSCLWHDNSGRRRDNRTFENRWPDQISAAATFAGKQTELSLNERKQRMEDESDLFSWKKTEFFLSHSKQKTVSLCLELEERHILLIRLCTKDSFLSNRQIDLIQGWWNILRSLKGNYLSLALVPRL